MSLNVKPFSSLILIYGGHLKYLEYNTVDWFLFLERRVWNDAFRLSHIRSSLFLLRMVLGVALVFSHGDKNIVITETVISKSLIWDSCFQGFRVHDQDGQRGSK